jgi:general secretion pathway protein G
MLFRSIVQGKRGELVNRIKFTGHRVRLGGRSENGFSLIELVIVVTDMTILTLGVLPLVKVSVQRRREQQLRDSLRQIRMAIDEFHRDTNGLNCSTAAVTGGSGTGIQVQAPVDPRSRVMISDCTIFGVDNPDRYPPTLQTLVDGVKVVPRGLSGVGGRGLQSTGTRPTDTSSVLDADQATKTKIYLRAIPIDPITGKADWEIRSCYDASDSTSWGGENVFDVRSKSRDAALNGEKYSDW